MIIIINVMEYLCKPVFAVLIITNRPTIVVVGLQLGLNSKIICAGLIYQIAEQTAEFTSIYKPSIYLSILINSIVIVLYKNGSNVEQTICRKQKISN